MILSPSLVETLKENIKDIDIEDFHHRMSLGESIHDILNLTPDIIHRCFIAGINKLHENQYNHALDIFVFLIAIDSMESQFYIGAGNALQYMHRYKDALEFYDIAMITNGNDPIPHLYAAKCYATLKDHKSAKNCLSIATTIAEQNMPEDKPILEAISKLHEELDKEKQNHGL